MRIIYNWETSTACQEIVLWTSVSDCKWCHPQALKMCTGGKWAPLRFCITPAPLHHFGTFIKCYHDHFFPSRLHCTSAKRISAPGLTRLWGNTDCLLIQGRCEQTWEGEMLLDSLSHWEGGELWGCWCLQLATPRAGTPECSCFSWTVLPPFFQLECLISCVVTVVSTYDVMCNTEHWKVHFI